MEPIWISAKEFADLKPVDVFGKDLGPKNKPSELLRNKHIWFKKSFSASDGKYIMDISADDYYKLYINGKFVGMGPSPAYHFCYNYNTFDITPYLIKGENEILVHTYYQGLANRYYNSGDLRQGMWAKITCDGNTVCATDESFLYAYDNRFSSSHSIGYETQYVEDIDADNNELIWLPACKKTVVDYKLVPQISKTCEVFEVKPKDIKKLAEKDYLFDFGEEIAGCLKITAKAGKAEIDIKYSEELDENGHALFNMRCMEGNCESWKLNGKDDVEAYDYRAFRYVEIFGDIDTSAVSVLRRQYPVKKEYELKTDNETLKDIYKICKNGVLVATQETFMDCPTREKGQYLGDMAVTAIAHSYITGDTTMYKKALIDFASSDFICKGLMCCVPGGLMQEIADYSLVYPYEIYKYWQISKDKETVQYLYPYVCNMLDYFKPYERPDGLLENVTEKWNLVDWPENLRDNYDFPLKKPIPEGCHNVINAYYYGALIYAKKLAEIIGKPADFGAERIKNAYNKAFFNNELGLYTDSEHTTHTALHSNALPLFFDMADNTEPLVDLIMQKGLCCGVWFSYFVLKGLVHANRKDCALKLILNESEHGWVNMLREGATTCFEAWGKDQKWNTSLCHPWAAAPVILMEEDLKDLI